MEDLTKQIFQTPHNISDQSASGPMPLLWEGHNDVLPLATDAIIAAPQ
jgi:hypothetical protein